MEKLVAAGVVSALLAGQFFDDQPLDRTLSEFVPAFSSPLDTVLRRLADEQTETPFSGESR